MHPKTNVGRISLASLLVIVVLLLMAAPVAFAATTVTVTPNNMNGWAFGWDTGDMNGFGGFTTGPAPAPMGIGSMVLAINSASGARPVAATAAWNGTAFSQITSLSYDTFVSTPTAPPDVLAITLSFNVDYDLTDANTAWQGRLTYEPYFSGIVQSGIWQSWNTLSGNWWASGAPGNSLCPQNSPCTWAQVLSNWPDAGVHATLGALVLKAGGPWPQFGGNVDALTIGVSGSDTVYDFEPPSTVYVDASWTATALWADPDGAGPATAYGLDAFDTIQDGIDGVAPGGTVNVAAGTYNESVAVNKRVSLIGAGSGASDTVVTATGGSDGVLQLSASGLSASQPVLVKDLRVEPIGKAGISVGLFGQSTGTSVSFVELDNVSVIGTNTNPCTEQERGLYVDLTSSLTNLKISDSAFDNLHYGWYLQKLVSADTSTVQYVDVANTTFNHNNLKGIYAEKLEDATFTDVIVDKNGYDTSIPTSACSYFAPWMSGVDVNLKAGAYQNLTFADNTIVNNGLGGAKEGVGLAIKARDDGATYGAFPATLNTVSIQDGLVAGNERGIRFGEPGKNNAGPTNVQVHDVCISGNVKTYSGIDGSPYGGLVNASLATTDAINNWWGSASGPYNSGSNPSGTGNAVVGPVTFSPWDTVGCGETQLSASTDDPLFCVGESTTVFVDLDQVASLYGYEFQISYNNTMASAAGAFVNSFFDTTPPVSIPPTWNAVCAAGVCKFAASHISTSAQQSVSGSGQLAKITLTGVAPGIFNMTISGSTLSDIDGTALSHTVAGPLPITVCGYATISGYVTMQGRPGNIVNPGTVTMIEQSPTFFTPVAPVAFTPANGAYSISVPYLPGGSSYKILAEHGLYLDNEDIFTVSANLSNKDTRLWGGDANNDDDVTILDLSCVGGDFGSAPPTSTCGGTGSPDINADNKVNIQDLSITGGNFDKCGAQPWAWNVATPNFCPL